MIPVQTQIQCQMLMSTLCAPSLPYWCYDPRRWLDKMRYIMEALK